MPTLLPQPLWLASDVHLTADDDALTARFCAWLRLAAAEAGAVILLGDLFDAWIGDDDLSSPLAAQVIAALRTVSDAKPLWLMHGNRDFLLGAEFARASGAIIADDPWLVEVAGVATVLTHGDALCTDDAAYQQFRQTVRNPSWRDDFLARPLSERRAIAAGLRRASESAKREKSMAIMDVNAPAVADLMREHQVTRLIHGHTHRPACHTESAGDNHWQRWVLPDWSATRAGYLRVDADGCALMDV